MSRKPRPPSAAPARRGGAPRAVGTLVDRAIRATGETRGFAETKLLTRWAEIAGAEVAAVSRPVKVRYPRGGFGAVLTLLTTGPQAPMLQMRLPALRDRVNACYGYAAIARIEVTQTAPTGFEAGQVAFAPGGRAERAPDPAAVERARSDAAGVGDAGLRLALERLGANVISKAAARRPRDAEGTP